MSCTIFKDEPSVDDWVASLRTFGASLEEGFADCSDVFGRNVGAHYLANEFVSGLIALRVDRLDVTHNAGVLSGTS